MIFTLAPVEGGGMAADDAEEVRPEVRRVLDALDDLERISDAGDRARALGQLLPRMPGLTSKLRQMRQQAVITLRQQGHSWQAIGDILGRHRQTAKDIYEGRSWRTRRGADGPADVADGAADER